MSESENLPVPAGTQVGGFAALQKDAKVLTLPKEIADKMALDPHYVPVMRLLQTSSGIVDEEAEKPVDQRNPLIRPGVFYLGDDTFIEGPIDIVICAQRWRAMIWENGKVAKNIFDETDPEFLEVLNHRGMSKQGGIELLMWLPDFNRAARFMLANTALKSAPEFMPGVLQCLDSKRVPGQGKKYYVPKARMHPKVFAQPSSARMKFAQQLAQECHQPNWEVFTDTIARFNACDPRADMPREEEAEEEGAPEPSKEKKGKRAR